MKKSLLLRFIIFVLILSVYSSTNSQWVQTNGPIGGKVFCTLISGSNILSGTNWCNSGGVCGYGVFISSNNGQSWSQTSMNNQMVYCFALSSTPGNIYAGTFYGLYISAE